MGSSPLRRQSGVTIPEMGVAVLVAGVLGAAAATGLGHAVRDNTATNVATQIAHGYDILNNYVAGNIDALVKGQPIAGVANPLQPTVQELQALGWRSFGTRSFLSPLNYSYSLALVPANCVPNTCNVAVYFGLDGAPRARDGTLDMAMAANIAGRIGRPAGFSSLSAPGNIAGLASAFVIANPTGANPGIVAAYGSYGAGQFANYVRMGDTRDVSLRGKLTVTGDISTGGTVTATGLITAQAGVFASNGRVWIQPAASVNARCGEPNGTVSTDQGGRVLSCQDGVWRIASVPSGNGCTTITTRQSTTAPRSCGPGWYVGGVGDGWSTTQIQCCPFYEGAVFQPGPDFGGN